jgi:DNA adenine methylase
MTHEAAPRPQPACRGQQAGAGSPVGAAPGSDSVAPAMASPPPTALGQRQPNRGVELHAMRERTLTAVPATAAFPIRRQVLSPLRYPGGKRRLVPYIAALLAENDLHPDLFVEPFAGGASVALELASVGLVKQIALADLDPWIAAFWETVFEDCDWLCRKIETIMVDLAMWDRLKRTRATSRRWRALACLFLNRTSFNGALHRTAGPIGGRAQTSDYDLACRFPRKRLIARLRACEQLALDGKVAWARCLSAEEAIRDARRDAKQAGQTTFFYLDPPFWAKSPQLYRYRFLDFHHEELAEQLRWLREPWLLSYDLADEVVALYEKHDVRRANVELLYTAAQRAGYEELVITNQSALPSDTRLWHTKAEWKHRRRAAHRP